MPRYRPAPRLAMQWCGRQAWQRYHPCNKLGRLCAVSSTPTCARRHTLEPASSNRSCSEGQGWRDMRFDLWVSEHTWRLPIISVPRCPWRKSTACANALDAKSPQAHGDNMSISRCKRQADAPRGMAFRMTRKLTLSRFFTSKFEVSVHKTPTVFLVACMKDTNPQESHGCIAAQRHGFNRDVCEGPMHGNGSADMQSNASTLHME